MSQMVSSNLFNYVTPVERIYRAISKPSPPKPAPKQSDMPSPLPLHLEWSDVDAILRHKREATPDELNYIVEHAKELHLTTWQRNLIGVALSIALVTRSRPKSDASAEFLYNTLHVVETPVGILQDCEWVRQELKTGAKAIADCRHHAPPRCACWRIGRERLWYIQDAFGAKSPEGWAATRLWELFEEYERASRPERTAGLGTASQPIPEEDT